MKVYLIEILRKGVDVRTEGLTWVLKKLLELNQNLETLQFPEFLDQGQINYLIKVAKLKNENFHINSIYNSLKIRPKTTTKYIFTNQVNKRNSTNILNSLPADLKSTFSHNFNDKSGSVLAHYKNLRGLGNNSLEDLYIKKTISDIKNNLSSEAQTETETLETQRSKDYDYLFQMKEILSANNLQIETLRKQEVKNFKKRYDSHRLINANQRITYDIVKAALFGNGVL